MDWPNMGLKSFAPRVAHSDRFHQRFALQRGRLTRCYASLAALVLVISPALLVQGAEPIKNHIICEYESTLDLKNGESGPTSGKILFVVYSLSETGSVVIEASDDTTKQVFEGKQSDSEITGTSTWNDERITEEFKINRYTGRFSETLLIDGKPGLVHYGNCQAGQERKF